MDNYSLYTYEFCPIEVIENELFTKSETKIDMTTEDKNLWLDCIFGDRNSDVRIQHVKKRGVGADKFPCKILGHEKRVIWLRLENEKIRRIWVKHHSKTPHEPDPINIEPVPDNPFSHIFLDCREGRNLIAMMKEKDAWSNTDVEAKLLEESLNILMQSLGYGFGIRINPVTATKDFWDYNRYLILKKSRKVKKMTIYFESGSFDPRVREFISNTPMLKRLLKEMWEAKRGKLELESPSGPRIIDKRKRDMRNIIELIGSNITSEAFGLSITYENGEEVVCGKDVRLMYPMKADMLSMLFSQDLFGEFEINKWLDRAVDYINKQKDGTSYESEAKRKSAKLVQGTSAVLDQL